MPGMIWSCFSLQLRWAGEYWNQLSKLLYSLTVLYREIKEESKENDDAID